MNLHYFAEWFHMYLMHFGAWVSFAIAASVVKAGLPEPSNIKRMLLSALILAAIVSIFSSHSHAKYLDHFLPAISEDKSE